MSRQPPPQPAAEYGQTDPVRRPSPVTVCGICRGFYVDDPDGRKAHRVVFGHIPADKIVDVPEGGG